MYVIQLTYDMYIHWQHNTMRYIISQGDLHIPIIFFLWHFLSEHLCCNITLLYLYLLFYYLQEWTTPPVDDGLAKKRGSNGFSRKSLMVIFTLLTISIAFDSAKVTYQQDHSRMNVLDWTSFSLRDRKE